MAGFDARFWEDHWASASTSAGRLPVNPYLPAETAGLAVGTALDAGCGAGAEARWLAEHGWRVTAADISSTALATARAYVADAALDTPVEWVEVDLARWEPQRTWDLVVTHYAHPDTGQLAFYRRLASWVAPGGTLLIVGHLHGHDDHGTHPHPEDATVTLDQITSLLTGPTWRLESGYERTRTVSAAERAVQLRDVVVRAHRIG